MTFNIRKLKIQIAAKENEMHRAGKNSWHRVRLEKKALEVALAIAVQNRADMRKAA